MTDYISREAAIAETRKPRLTDAELRRRLANIPAADVRPVVLCKDCKWCHAGYCEKFDDIIPWGCEDRPWEEWFCADGEKMEES